MAWSDKTTLTGLNAALSETTNAGADYVATNHFSGWVTLNPGESAHLQIEAAFDATGGDMFFRVVGTLDAATEAADSIALVAGSLGYVPSTTQKRSILVTGPYKFRVEVRKGSGTLGSYTPNVYMRKNGISV